MPTQRQDRQLLFSIKKPDDNSEIQTIDQKNTDRKLEKDLKKNIEDNQIQAYKLVEQVKKIDLEIQQIQQKVVHLSTQKGSLQKQAEDLFQGQTDTLKVSTLLQSQNQNLDQLQIWFEQVFNMYVLLCSLEVRYLQRTPDQILKQTDLKKGFFSFIAQLLTDIEGSTNEMQVNSQNVSFFLVAMCCLQAGFYDTYYLICKYFGKNIVHGSKYLQQTYNLRGLNKSSVTQDSKSFQDILQERIQYVQYVDENFKGQIGESMQNVQSCVNTYITDIKDIKRKYNQALDKYNSYQSFQKNPNYRQIESILDNISNTIDQIEEQWVKEALVKDYEEREVAVKKSLAEIALSYSVTTVLEPLFINTLYVASFSLIVCLIANIPEGGQIDYPKSLPDLISGLGQKSPFWWWTGLYSGALFVGQIVKSALRRQQQSLQNSGPLNPNSETNISLALASSQSLQYELQQPQIRSSSDNNNQSSEKFIQISKELQDSFKGFKVRDVALAVLNTYLVTMTLSQIAHLWLHGTLIRPYSDEFLTPQAFNNEAISNQLLGSNANQMQVAPYGVSNQFQFDSEISQIRKGALPFWEVAFIAPMVGLMQGAYKGLIERLEQIDFKQGYDGLANLVDSQTYNFLAQFKGAGFPFSKKSQESISYISYLLSSQKQITKAPQQESDLKKKMKESQITFTFLEAFINSTILVAEAMLNQNGIWLAVCTTFFAHSLVYLSGVADDLYQEEAKGLVKNIFKDQIYLDYLYSKTTDKQDKSKQDNFMAPH